MRKFLVACTLVAVALCASASANADDAIKEVMKVAQKGGLMKKVADGNATPEEQKKLVELYKQLAAASPPKGDAASWKEKTAALVQAAENAAAGKPDAGKALLKAGNCAGCHGSHKPS